MNIFEVCSVYGFLRVGKDEFDRESLGPWLNQIFAFTKEEFMAVVEAQEESSYYSSTSGEDGDSESGEEEEGHDGGEDGSEEEDLGEEEVVAIWREGANASRH